ncbi:hypothetical protein K435DRAFT_798445 [Dendrothele bispora CBS 962.96]|uniref:Uncharacterized protein n=1 Tax=Dendrothele bispora (strain CBS 962.96) TaxID=1314807 RepID=A0A4S8LZ47_DENBC|nr:hypothetical protein K435DRAFT_798445 [Dendrothele bispora CBS 962.96]
MSDPTSLSPTTAAMFQTEIHQLQITTYVATATLGVSNVNDSLTVIALSSVTFLFFLRLRAIYEGNRWVAGVFFVLWLGNVASIALDFEGIILCIEQDIKIRNASITAIGALVYDTCIFIAISYRLLKNNTASERNAGFKTATETFVLGKNLPRLSKVLFQDCQMLYL